MCIDLNVNPFTVTIEKIPRLHIIGPAWGNQTATSGFPSQRASNAESVSMPGPHHILRQRTKSFILIFYKVHVHVLPLQCQTASKSFHVVPLQEPSAGCWCFHGYATRRCQTSWCKPATWFLPKILKWRWISVQIEMVFSWKSSLRKSYHTSWNGNQMNILI